MTEDSEIQDERRRVLTMVSEGIISPSEAQDLLDALDPPREEPAWPAAPTAVAVASPRRAQGHSLILEITGGETHVNLNIPIGLALNPGFLPRRAQEYLRDMGIDLQQVLAEFGSSDARGTILEIADGEERVFIGVR